MQKSRTSPRIFRNKHLLLVAAAAAFLAIPAWSAASPADDYLQAWSYKDYPTMYSMLRPQDRPTSEQAFAEAAAKSAPSELPQIVQMKTSGTSQLVYFHYSDSLNHQAMNSSIQVFPDGIRHPDLVEKTAVSKPINLEPATANAALQTPSQSATASAAQPIQSGGGAARQGSHILQKMEQATAAIKNFTVNISMQGNIMGQNVNEAGTLIYMAPNSFQMSTMMFVVNGQNGKITLYMPQMQTQMDISSAMAGDFAPGLPGLLGGDAVKQAELLATSTQNGIPTYKLKVPDTSGASGGLMLSQLGGGAMNSPTILTVNGQTWLPIQAEKSGVTITYSGYQFNRPDVSAATFHLNVPKSAQTFSLDALMGAK